jgi:hypothetical protein
VDSNTETPSFPVFDAEESSYLSLDTDHVSNNDKYVAGTCDSDSHLEDAVFFLVAFTNSALHEVKLLKLLHDIGAPLPSCH